MTHSVSRIGAANGAAGAICAVAETRRQRSNAVLSPHWRSRTTASMSAPAIIAARCFGSASGGKMVRRRTTPSSSIRASAVVSWLPVATRTDLPANSPSRPLRLVPPARSVKRKRALRSKKNRSAAPMLCRSVSASVRAIFVDFHEVAESYGKQRVLGRREWIDAEPVFEARDQNGEAERVRAQNPAARDRHSAAPESCRARARSPPSGPLWLILPT